MGKTSKFSFPLPGRKNYASKTSEDLTLPEEPKLSKIERILGTSNLPPQYQITANKSPLTFKLPSSLTLNLYEPTIASGRSELDFPLPELPKTSSGVSTTNVEIDEPWESEVSIAPPRSLSLSQAQSPRLTAEAPKRNHPRSRSSTDVLSIQHGKLRPSTTNGGHAYTAIQIDSPISQKQKRTSNPRQSNVNTHKLFPVVETTAVDTQDGESYPLSGFKPGAKPSEKKRPTMLDLSKLLGRSASASTPNLLKTVTSPSGTAYPHNPPRFPSDIRSPSDLTSPPLKMSMSRRFAKKASQSTSRVIEQTIRPKTTDSSAATMHSTKTSPVKSRTSKHWFDGLLEAEDAALSEVDADVEEPESYRETGNEDSLAHQDKRMHNSRMSPKKFKQADTLSPTAAERSSDVPVAYIGSARCIRPVCSQRLEQIMQKQPSPLISDFDEEDVKPSRGRASTVNTTLNHNLPDVRDSIAVSEVGETITIGKAQALHVPSQHRRGAVGTVQVRRVMQPRQVRIGSSTPSSSVPSSAQSASDDRTDTEVSVGLGVDSLLSQPADTESQASLQSPLISTGGSLLSDRSLRPDPKHKMMAVTPEEEALLAMMREKRAAMQSHSFAEGFKTAMMSNPQSPELKHISKISRNNSSNNKVRVERARSSPWNATRPSQFRLHEQTPAAHDAEILAPQPTRVFFSPSTTSQFSVSPTPAEDRQAQSSTPEIGNLILESSPPSEKSVHSGTQSPVTPHSASASASIKIAMSSLPSEPWLRSEDFSDDDVFTISHASPSHHSLITDNAKFAEVPITADRSLVDDSKAPQEVVQGTAHIIQQLKAPHKPAAIMSAKRSKTVNSRRVARPHEHQNGCCEIPDTRCSVANDVMAAWTSLGGWQEQRSPLY